MLAALELMPRMLQALLRHLFAYGELAYEESLVAAQRVRRRLLGGVIVCMASMLALLMGCVWVIAATWDGPDRQIAVGGLCLGFLLVAVIGAIYALGGRAAGAPFQHLRAEWRRDLQQIARLDPTLVGSPGAAAMGGSRAEPE